jgi:transposase
MLSLPASVRIFLCTRAVDMRLSFDRLAMLAEHVLEESSCSGHLFVFFNRRSDRVKILYWDRDGYAIYYKRLEQGTYAVPEAEGARVEMTEVELGMILGGIDWKRTRKRRRYEKGASGGKRAI